MELHPCPFCNNTIIHFDWLEPVGDTIDIYAECGTCYARGPKVTMKRGTQCNEQYKEAGKAWKDLYNAK